MRVRSVITCLLGVVSPHVLVGVKKAIGGFKPAVMGDYVLWNADQLFWRNNVAARR